ncbi:MAG: two-component sensor histidine kinase, partial [Calditrichaeota bacterium]
MKNIFQSLYSKISAIFLVLLLLLVVVQIYVSTTSSARFVQESEQKLNRNLAHDIAKEFEPFLQDSIHYGEIKHLMHYLMVMNPRVEIYLIDAGGRILAYFTGPGKKVWRKKIDLRPVKRFLQNQADFPVLGDDPRNLARKKPFSAATIQLPPNNRGYLYVILGSEQYDSVIDMIRESYILRITSLGLLVTISFTALLGLILFAML